MAAAAAHPMAFALAIFLLAALVIGWPWLSGRVTIPWDAKAHFQPQIQFLAQSLARGESPSWAPFVFSGHPQIADPQAMIFSPPFLVLALVGRRAQPVGGRCHRARCGGPRRRGPDAVVPRPGLALGGRADRGAGVQLRGVDGLAHPAHRPGAEPRLPADRHGLPRPRAGARLVLYGVAAGVVAAGIVLGRDQVALLASICWRRFGVWRIFSAEQPRAALRAGVLPLGAGGVCALASSPCR